MKDVETWINTTRKFNHLWDQFQDSEANINYVLNNLNNIKLINNLIGEKDTENKLINLLSNNKKLLPIILLLIKTRKKEKMIPGEVVSAFFDYRIPFHNEVEEYIYFMKASGIMKKLVDGSITDISKYIIDIETKILHHSKTIKTEELPLEILETEFNKHNLIINKTYFKNVDITWFHHQLIQIPFINLPSHLSYLFDYVIKLNDKIIIINYIFPTIPGSKVLDKLVICIYYHELFTNVSNIKYILIMDGQGCLCMPNSIKKAIKKGLIILNFNDIKNGELQKIIEE